MKIEFIDIKRAYLQVDAKREVYVELPQEDWEEGKCAKLIKAMYGTRDLRRIWNKHTARRMRSGDSKLGRHHHA